MHCYRVTTFNPDHPVYILRATQQKAFELARANTVHSHSPVVALIDLPTNKDSLIDQLNDPQMAIGEAPSLKAWEFTPSARGALAHEIEPNSGERKAQLRKEHPVLDAKFSAMEAIVEHGKQRPPHPANKGLPWPDCLHPEPVQRDRAGTQRKE
jgi:hypothetical protein